MVVRSLPPSGTPTGPMKHSLVAATYEAAMSLYDKGRYDDALAKFQESSEQHTMCDEGDAELLANIFLGQGICYHALRQWDDACELYKACLDALSAANLGDTYQGFATPLINLGLLYFKQGRSEEALQCYRRAQKLLEKQYCTDRMAVADLYHNMAVVFDSQDQLQSALQYYAKSLRIRERFEPTREQQLLLAVTKENVAMIWRDQDNQQEAMKMMNTVLPIRKKFNGALSAEYGNSLFNMGLLCFDLGRVNSALSYLSKCLNIRRQVLGPDSQQTRICEQYVQELEQRGSRHPSVYAHLSYRSSSPNNPATPCSAAAVEASSRRTPSPGRRMGSATPPRNTDRKARTARDRISLPPPTRSTSVGSLPPQSTPEHRHVHPPQLRQGASPAWTTSQQ
eukprot:Sspe_Gene.19699::Locus_7192_Transcript_1_1_Confidence_1.000_Length_1253::g.19699::m.19699